MKEITDPVMSKIMAQVEKLQARYENRQREELGPVGRALEDSIKGQPNSWKNALTRKVIRKYFSRKPIYDREFIESFRATQDKLGEEARQENKRAKDKGFLYV